MKKLCLLVMLICSMLFTVGEAASIPAGATVTSGSRPCVAVLYVNNAKTKFDREIDKNVLANLTKCITPDKYVYVDGKVYIEKLNKMGIMDITTAERSDIVECLQGESVDYVVFLEVQPMVRKEKVHFFNYGIEMTTQVPFKIIDVVNNKYLYNGKFTEKGEDETIIGGLGNKGSALKAIKKVNKQIATVISTRLPVTKPVKRVEGRRGIVRA